MQWHHQERNSKIHPQQLIALSWKWLWDLCHCCLKALSSWWSHNLSWPCIDPFECQYWNGWQQTRILRNCISQAHSQMTIKCKVPIHSDRFFNFWCISGWFTSHSWLVGWLSTTTMCSDSLIYLLDLCEESWRRLREDKSTADFLLLDFHQVRKEIGSDRL
jgi:hypothetical protein